MHYIVFDIGEEVEIHGTYYSLDQFVFAGRSALI